MQKDAEKKYSYSDNYHGVKGLGEEEVNTSRRMHGRNILGFNKENPLVAGTKHVITEPMVILLVVASTIYFITGETGDGIFLSCAILFQASISLFQSTRSDKALEKLKDLSQPRCKVIREGKVTEIAREDLVVGDSMLVAEGEAISADGVILQSNDFSVNESLLTGESLPVQKDKTKDNNAVYSGTTVNSGLAVAEVTAVGNLTRLGKIGRSLESITQEKTPLEKQIDQFVKWMALSGILVFVLVWILNYLRSYSLLNSLMQALTLAMSILPEEIPVAFTTFMAMGAWRLMKMGIVVKQMKTVETLGSATVICVDKTGTITENRMSLAAMYLYSGNRFSSRKESFDDDETELIRTAMWASETVPFDPMEKALHEAYSATKEDERGKFRMIHEYPLEGKPPMMTHVFEDQQGTRIIAAKGAPEALIQVSNLNAGEKEQVLEAGNKMAKEGYRILGVGISSFKGEKFPDRQQDLPFRFIGLVAFYDPPRKNIAEVFRNFYSAGIKVKIITGDNALTTSAIAQQTGFRGPEKTMSGDELMRISDEELRTRVNETNVFSRMFPEAKLRIINALKANKHVVAMTGDGVNDGPALKAAHIGIAMGKRGTEIARQTASLVLLEDDLSQMVKAIAMGRKIYGNLKKAIQYIISIHIPIILAVFIPLILDWIYPNIFSPVHIIFLEIIMGPTCSIIYENEPIEKNAMQTRPRSFSTSFFHWRELSTSILQGVMIATGILLIYQYSVREGYNEELTRTMVFTSLITSNIFLTLVNRSFFYSIFTTLTYKNNLIPFIILLTLGLLLIILYVGPVNRFFEFEMLSGIQLFLCMTAGCSSTVWYELVKLYKRKKEKK